MLKVPLMVLIYYPLSIGLTFYQKWFIKNYRFPLFIVLFHYLTKFLIAYLVRFLVECYTKTRRVRVPLRQQLQWLMPVGICASLDIGLSNWALEYVTISLYTMAKSSSILFIVGFSLLLRLERWKPILGATAALISSGLFLFTWKSTQLDLLGLLLIELAALCTGIRWAVSQYIMQREETPTPLRHPLDMVAHVQPWMILAILPMILIFEGSEITFQSITHYNGAFQPFVIFSLLVTGGLIAFLMEMSEYLLLMATSGITLNILGIIKEVISLLLAHLLHGDNYVSGVNLVGLLLVFIGMSLHGFSRHKAPAHSLTPPPRIISPSTDFADDRKFLLLDEPS